MSTKNISRSALEGGRNTSNKFDRNESHRRERNHFRTWVNHAIADDEFADANPIPERPPVYKGFTDKLNPCYRWLASRSGQPWSAVYSELKAKFDTRNLASWHVVNQHMLTSVLGSGTENNSDLVKYRSFRFAVDDDGILRDRGVTYRSWLPFKEADGTQLAYALAFANGRKVIESWGEYRSWAKLVPDNTWVPCEGRRCRLAGADHRRTETTSKALIDMYGQSGFKTLGEGGWWRTFAVEHLKTAQWRMLERFNKAESAWWKELPWQVKGKLTVER